MNGLMILLVLLAVIVVGIWLFAKRSPQPRQGTAYDKLRQRAMGDQALVERLIEMERQRHPDASEARLIRYALERWKRDNR